MVREDDLIALRGLYGTLVEEINRLGVRCRLVEVAALDDNRAVLDIDTDDRRVTIPVGIEHHVGLAALDGHRDELIKAFLCCLLFEYQQRHRIRIKRKIVNGANNEFVVPVGAEGWLYHPDVVVFDMYPGRHYHSLSCYSWELIADPRPPSRPEMPRQEPLDE